MNLIAVMAYMALMRSLVIVSFGTVRSLAIVAIVIVIAIGGVVVFLKGFLAVIALMALRRLRIIVTFALVYPL